MLGVFLTWEKYWKSCNACHFFAIGLDHQNQIFCCQNRRSVKLSFPSRRFYGSWGLLHWLARHNIVACSMRRLFGAFEKHFCPSLSLYCTTRALYEFSCFLLLPFLNGNSVLQTHVQSPNKCTTSLLLENITLLLVLPLVELFRSQTWTLAKFRR